MKKLFILSLVISAFTAKSQTADTSLKTSSLKNEIIAMDSLLFNVAFNQCDSVLYKKIIADDIEFYDDRSGLNKSKQNEMNFLAEKCSRKENLTRVLKYCTVDKLGDFGAVQLGEHSFVLNGVVVGSAKFIHIWERTKQGWQLKRIVSYEHVSTHN